MVRSPELTQLDCNSTLGITAACLSSITIYEYLFRPLEPVLNNQLKGLILDENSVCIMCLSRVITTFNCEKCFFKVIFRTFHDFYINLHP